PPPLTAGALVSFSVVVARPPTYTLIPSTTLFPAGSTYSDTFAVESADGTLTSVTIHIAGTNDAAVLSAAVANLTETNLAADISTAGTLTISDVDSPATFVAQAATAGTYGTFAIDNPDATRHNASHASIAYAARWSYTHTF